MRKRERVLPSRSEFYLVDAASRVGRGMPIHFNATSKVSESVYNGYYEGKTMPPRRLVVVRETGSVACDWHSIFNLWGKVISRSFVMAARASHLRGWDCFPLTAIGVGGVSLPGYYGLVVLGRAGPIDKSAVRMIRRRNEVGRIDTRLVGYDLRPEEWDGSDLFFSKGNGCLLFCSKKARDVFQAAGLKGMEFPLIREHEWSFELD